MAELFPGSGFFGATPDLALVVPINATATEVRLSINDEFPTYLNLQAVQIVGTDGQALMPATEWEESASSMIAGSSSVPALLRGKAIHSKEELRPWWRVSFNSPVEIAQLKIFNRRDTWGRRARNLMVEIIEQDGKQKIAFENGGSNSAIALFLELGARGLLQPDGLPSEPDSLRLGWIKEVVKHLDSGNYGEINWRAVLALLPIWGNRSLVEHELRLIAHFLLDQLKSGDDFAIAYFSAPLFSANQITRLMAVLNDICGEREMPRLMATRHGLQREGKLRANRDSFLSAASQAIEILSMIGAEPALAYGTLLGAARESDFIAHDDDLDLLCRVAATDFGSARAAMEKIAASLQAAGFVCEFSSASALNLHAHHSSTGALIDIFPYWVDEDRAFLHMERMAIRAIPSSIVEERDSISLCQQLFPTFKNWNAFLDERYGPDWKIPQIFFEWPWTLKPELTSEPQ